MERDLHILPRISDLIGYVYVEHAAIERKDSSIVVRTRERTVDLPAATLATLVLGPGTTISHAAVVALAECGTGLIWSGEEQQRFYASGVGRTRSAENAAKQAMAWADPKLHMEVVLRMYRFRFSESLSADLSLQQIRGKEGVRVREAYANAAKESGIEWSGRNYDRAEWSKADPVNRALSAGAACLYGVCHSAIESMGFHTALGFIHTGKHLSFVYDVADLYKADLLIPAAFCAAVETPERPEPTVRIRLREAGRSYRLLERLASDLPRLFADLPLRYEPDESNRDKEDSAGNLWDKDDSVSGGIDYGRNDA